MNQNMCVSKLSASVLSKCTPEMLDLILKKSRTEWRGLLRCFWDERGIPVFDVRMGGKGRIVRRLEAPCANNALREWLVKLHRNLGIHCYARGNKIIISGRRNLTKFSELIGFSKGVKIEGGLLWRGLEKNLVLDHILGSYRRRKLVYVKNYGCTANTHDLEIMLAYLGRGGYEIVDVPELADVLLVNTCGVKKTTEDKVLFHLRSLSRLGKPIIITGCLPKINLPAIKKAVPNYSAIMDPYSVDKILLVVKKAEQGEKNQVFFSQKPEIKPRLPKVRINRLVEIIQIAEGCTGFCAFCCVRFARGKLFSYPKELLVERARKAVKAGAREIWITAQDTGAYGRDIGGSLVELLEEICRIEGKFFVRVGMMNPNHALRMLRRLIEIYKNEKIFKFLHLPVQSGDDEVLRLMNRPYTTAEFRTVVQSFRRHIPNITIATDVICGFPGETQKAFERTLRLLEEVQPDVVNVSRFFPRPGTPAERMESRVPPSEIKRRSRKTAELVRRISLEKNRAWVGWEGDVLIDEVGKKPGSWIGRNFAYKPIVVKTERPLLGELVRIRVVNAFQTYLEARL